MKSDLKVLFFVMFAAALLNSIVAASYVWEISDVFWKVAFGLVVISWVASISINFFPEPDLNPFDFSEFEIIEININ